LIFDMRLACYSQQEIADKVGLSKMEISRIANKTEELPKCYQSAANHGTTPHIPVRTPRDPARKNPDYREALTKDGRNNLQVRTDQNKTHQASLRIVLYLHAPA